MAKRADHGFWPYLAPMFVFLGLVELSGRAGDGYSWLFLPSRVLVPLVMVLVFASRGRYPELRSHGEPTRAGTWLADVAVGIAGAVLWMAPYLLFPSLQPEPDKAFDPSQLGDSFFWLALSLRALGYAVVTPFVEELFVRSWLLRYIDVFQGGDFRKVPIGRFTPLSCAVVVAYFTFSHMPWEYPVAFVWVLLTQWWFYRRKDLRALVVVHAASNLTIFLAAAITTGAFHGTSGATGLWFFL